MGSSNPSAKKLYVPSNDSDRETNFGNNQEIPEVGDKFDVHWPDDKQYYSGLVASCKPTIGKHNAEYDDGDKEQLEFKVEICRFTANIEGITANEVELSPGSNLSSVEKETIGNYYTVFGSKEFFLVMRKVYHRS